MPISNNALFPSPEMEYISNFRILRTFTLTIRILNANMLVLGVQRA
jgi:hypothetical protein